MKGSECFRLVKKVVEVLEFKNGKKCLVNIMFTHGEVKMRIYYNSDRI